MHPFAIDKAELGGLECGARKRLAETGEQGCVIAPQFAERCLRIELCPACSREKRHVASFARPRKSLATHSSDANPRGNNKHV